MIANLVAQGIHDIQSLSLSGSCEVESAPAAGVKEETPEPTTRTVFAAVEQSPARPANTPGQNARTLQQNALKSSITFG